MKPRATLDEMLDALVDASTKCARAFPVEYVRLARKVIHLRAKIHAHFAASPQTAAGAPQSPSYEALLIIAQSVVGALARAGVTDCDDPGEAIDIIRERLEAKVAALQQSPANRTAMPDGEAAQIEADDSVLDGGVTK